MHASTSGVQWQGSSMRGLAQEIVPVTWWQLGDQESSPPTPMCSESRCRCVKASGFSS